MWMLDSILRRLGYIRVSEFESRLRIINAHLFFTTELLKKAVQSNQPKTTK